METNNLVSEMPVKKGIPGSTLKIIAIIVMFIDHFAAIMLEPVIASCESMTPKFYTTYAIYCLMRLIGRLGFPIFCFLLVEGFSHTHSKLKYLRNLAIFALISEVPFDLGFMHSPWNMSYQNVFFTLLIGLLALVGIDFIEKRESLNKVLTYAGLLGYVLSGIVAVYFLATSTIGGFIDGFCSQTKGSFDISVYQTYSPKMFATGAVVGVIILIVCLIALRKKGIEAIGRTGLCLAVLFVTFFMAELLETDYSGSGVLTIVTMYYFKKKSNMKAGVAGCIVLTIMQIIECSAFFTLIPIKKYNGERGISLKYFFYAFYPVHILLIYLLSVLLGFNTLPWIG